jgi:queuine/archaeosine tRNA-ribosyltransferase
MNAKRQKDLSVGGKILKLPCFFPSISSVKTNLTPLEYLRVLVALRHPLFLISAYDIYNSSNKEKNEIAKLLKRAFSVNQTILLDSGNYESYWKNDKFWDQQRYKKILNVIKSQLAFCFDQQNFTDSLSKLVEDIEGTVQVTQDLVSEVTILPIVHCKVNDYPKVVLRVTKKLHPMLIAVPERSLGSGILERASTVYKIRENLNQLGIYYPLHILGTGNPLSIMIYSFAGADSFDGLEWCQTAVNHDTALLYHFQQRELFDNQTKFAWIDGLPYDQATLAHNLFFYRNWMEKLQNVISSNGALEFANNFIPIKE